jgi:hypothetical protein
MADISATAPTSVGKSLVRGQVVFASRNHPSNLIRPDLESLDFFLSQVATPAASKASARADAAKKFKTEWDSRPREDHTASWWEPDFRLRCERGWVNGADVNDVMHNILTNVPRRMNLQLNGDCEGVCIAPWLCVNYYLGMPFEQLKEITGKDFGRFLKWGFGRNHLVHRASAGAKRHNNALDDFIFLWVDPTGSPPYVTPGKPSLVKLPLHAKS